MAIEFRCPQCQKLLRTQDDTAGKKAKCPQCGTIVPIPHPPGSPHAPPAAGAPPGGPPPDYGGFGGSPYEPPPAQPGSANPYQSPTFQPGYGPSDYQPRAGRWGPPWEHEGASFGSFFETVKMAYSDLGEFYDTMRREGGLGAPIGFAIAGGYIGLIATVIYQFTCQGAILALGAPGAGNEAAGTAMAGVCAMILFPLIALVYLFLWSGIYHLFLMMLGAANYSFETTFRVLAYTWGVTSLLAIIPICGSFISPIVQIIFTIIGLASLQAAGGLKAAGAVLLPLLVCCCLVGSVYGFIIAAAVAAG